MSKRKGFSCCSRGLGGIQGGDAFWLTLLEVMLETSKSLIRIQTKIKLLIAESIIQVRNIKAKRVWNLKVPVGRKVCHGRKRGAP